jgi:uncharacterized protein (DUF305 family)
MNISTAQNETGEEMKTLRQDWGSMVPQKYQGTISVSGLDACLLLDMNQAELLRVCC